MRYHSRTFQALRVAAEALTTESFPLLNGSAPKVVYGDPFGVQDGALEHIGVVLRVDDDQITYERMPAGRDETFSIEIGISTAHKGRSGGQVVDRLEELTQVVEGIFYDLDSGAPRLLAVEGVTNLSLVSRVALEVWPGSEGYEGSSVVTFLVRCRL